MKNRNKKNCSNCNKTELKYIIQSQRAIPI